MEQEGRRRILVVDDDDDLVDIIEEILVSEGYLVDRAPNGLEALKVISRSMPDLILLDMKMPVMDGWQFAQEYKCRPEHSAPIVVVTAAESAQKRARDVSAVGWLGKPFNLDELIDLVKKRVEPGPVS